MRQKHFERMTKANAIAGQYGRRQHGSALLLAIWAAAILTLSIIGVIQVVGYHIDESTAAERSFRSRLLAESGLAFGLQPIIEKGDPLLSQTIRPNEKFTVHFASEAGRLQINYLLITNRRDILRTLFYRWGLSPAEADEVFDNLRAWIEGHETRDGQSPKTQQISLFQSVEEMAVVPGMDLVAQKHSSWRDAFTVWTDGKVDVNEASPEVIEAVCGVDLSRAEKFCDYRLGPDQTADTEDDIRYTDLNQVRQKLGLSEAAFAKVALMVILDSPIRRVESTGAMGTFQHRITVIVRTDANPPQYLDWQEQ